MIPVVLMSIQCDDYIVDIVPVPPMVALNDNGYAGMCTGDEGCVYCNAMLAADPDEPDWMCDECLYELGEQWEWV